MQHFKSFILHFTSLHVSLSFFFFIMTIIYKAAILAWLSLQYDFQHIACCHWELQQLCAAMHEIKKKKCHLYHVIQRKSSSANIHDMHKRFTGV